MIIERTKTGLKFLDDTTGGLYLRLPTLVKGARNSGKTVLAAHLTDRILRLGEKVMVFCETAPEAAILEARSAGIDFEQPARTGQLLLIPIHDVRESQNGAFPFDSAIDELHTLASRSSVGFAVFSSVVPWLAANPPSEMPSRVDAFLAALSSLSMTSLLLVHKAASAPAERLVEKLVSACPIVLEMEAFESAQRELRVVKYNGRDDLVLPLVFPLDLVPGKGLVQPPKAEPAAAAALAELPRDTPPAPAPAAHRRATLFTPASPHALAPAASAAPAQQAAPAAPQRRATLFSAATEPILARGETPAPAPAPAPAAAPSPAAPHRRATLFSSVIEPEHPTLKPTQAEPAPEAQEPRNRASRIRFSNVIR